MANLSMVTIDSFATAAQAYFSNILSQPSQAPVSGPSADIHVTQNVPNTRGPSPSSGRS